MIRWMLGLIVLAFSRHSGADAMNTERLEVFARAYTDAWNCGDAERVAAHIAEGATLGVNGEPASRRAAGKQSRPWPV